MLFPKFLILFSFVLHFLLFLAVRLAVELSCGRFAEHAAICGIFLVSFVNDSVVTLVQYSYIAILCNKFCDSVL